MPVYCMACKPAFPPVRPFEALANACMAYKPQDRPASNSPLNLPPPSLLSLQAVRGASQCLHGL